jgi:hypothetical protein
LVEQVRQARRDWIEADPLERASRLHQLDRLLDQLGRRARGLLVRSAQRSSARKGRRERA